MLAQRHTESQNFNLIPKAHVREPTSTRYCLQAKKCIEHVFGYFSSTMLGMMKNLPHKINALMRAFSLQGGNRQQTNSDQCPLEKVAINVIRKEN